jgi:hypothetical protein
MGADETNLNAVEERQEERKQPNENFHLTFIKTAG